MILKFVRVRFFVDFIYVNYGLIFEKNEECLKGINVLCVVIRFERVFKYYLFLSKVG